MSKSSSNSSSRQKPDPVAVITPGIVYDVGLRLARCKLNSEPFGEWKRLDIDCSEDCELCAR